MQGQGRRADGAREQGRRGRRAAAPSGERQGTVSRKELVVTVDFCALALRRLSRCAVDALPSRARRS